MSQPQPVTHVDLPILPPWEAKQDANGRTYYVNHATKTTQWEHPGQQSVTTQASQTINHTVNVTASVFSQFANAVLKPQSQPQPQLQGLSYPWEVRQDANGRTYYVNHATKSTQWEHPNQSGH